MLHQQTLHLVQSGAKYFFDVDPVLTEHIVRNLFFQTTLISYSASLVIRELGDKFADGLSPMLHEIRNLKLSIPGF